MKAERNSPRQSPRSEHDTRPSDAHLQQILEECSDDQDVDIDLLVRRCGGDASLFAAACRIGRVELPHIPIDAVNLRCELRDIELIHYVSCKVPSELNHLDASDKTRITHLVLEFEEGVDIQHLATAAALLCSYSSLKNCVLAFDDKARPDSVDLMCGLLAEDNGAPLEVLHLSTQMSGLGTRLSCQGAVQLLQVETLKTVVAEGPLPAYIATHALKRLRPRETALTDLVITGLAAGFDSILPQWLDGLHHPILEMRIDSDSDHPQLLIGQIAALVKNGNLTLDWIAVRSATYLISHRNPLVLLMARRSIRARIPKYEPKRTLHAFGEVLRNGLGDPFSDRLARWLGAEDLHQISMSTKSSYIAHASERLLPAAVDWAHRRLRRNMPEDFVIAVLSANYGAAFARKVRQAMSGPWT